MNTTDGSSWQHSQNITDGILNFLADKPQIEEYDLTCKLLNYETICALKPPSVLHGCSRLVALRFVLEQHRQWTGTPLWRSMIFNAPALKVPEISFQAFSRGLERQAVKGYVQFSATDSVPEIQTLILRYYGLGFGPSDCQVQSRLRSLQHLIIIGCNERCLGSFFTTLTILAASTGSLQTLKLKSLRMSLLIRRKTRAEWETCLEDFLLSFRGLEILEFVDAGINLSSGGPIDWVACFNHHGETLKTLRVLSGESEVEPVYLPNLLRCPRLQELTLGLLKRNKADIFVSLQPKISEASLNFPCQSLQSMLDLCSILPVYETLPSILT